MTLNALTDVANAVAASLKGMREMREMIHKVESIDPENPEVLYKIYFQGERGAKGRALGQIIYHDGKKDGNSYDDARSVGESGWAYTCEGKCCEGKYTPMWCLKRIRNNVYTIINQGAPTKNNGYRKGWQLIGVKIAKDKRQIWRILGSDV